MAFLYKDLFKPVKSIVETDFNSSQQEFTVKSTTTDGTKLEFTGSRGSKSGELEGGFKWNRSYVHDTRTYTVSGELSSTGLVKATGELVGPVKGLKVKTDLSMFTQAEKRDEAKTSFEYRNADVAVAGDLQLPRSAAEPFGANLSVLGGRKGFFAGGSAKVDARSGKLQNYELGMRYSRPSTDVMASFDAKSASVKFGVAHALRTPAQPTSVALQVVQPVQGNAAAGLWTFGVARRMGADSACKVRVNNRGDAAMLYQLQVNANLTADVTTSWNMSDASKSAVGVSFGYNA